MRKRSFSRLGFAFGFFVLLAPALCAQSAGRIRLQLSGQERGGQILSPVADGPGWEALPPLKLRVDASPAQALPRIWVMDPATSKWSELTFSEGAAALPFAVPSRAALWSLKVRVASNEPVDLSLEPSSVLTMAAEPASHDPETPAFSLANWGSPARILVTATDADGAPVPLACLTGPNPCDDEGGVLDLGILDPSVQAEILALPAAAVHYPVTIVARDEAGHAASQMVANPRNEAGGYDQVVYYGVAPANFNCSAQPVTNGTKMVITAITPNTTYTVTNLSAGSVFATGTLVAKGDQVTVSSLPDNSKIKLAASNPVQAYMGYDCSGTLPGTMFYLSDDGLSMYGTSFTVPLADYSDGRLQYWIFSTGAGTATVKTMAGATITTLTFSAAGARQISLSNTYVNTVIGVTSSGPAMAVEQSSQNAATEVPPTTQMASPGACTVTPLGRSFYFHLQPWSGQARVAVVPYGGTGQAGDSFTLTQLTGGSFTRTVTGLTAGTLYYDNTMNLSSGAYQVTSTVDVGLLAGSLEPGPAPNGVWDIGDDAIYLRGTGSEVRGLPMRCGGTVFIGQDGTTLSGTCTPGSPCGLPSLPQTLNADSFVTLSGNTSNTNLFDLATQDAAHPILVEVFGGNCATQLNDWSKVMQPAALLRPLITNPGTSGYLSTLNPVVTGYAVPGATVTVRIYDAGPPVGTTPVFTGSGTAAADGSWSIPVTVALAENHLYYFEPVQALPGACPVNALPPPGSSGSQGRIDTTPPNPPVIASPADGSSTTNTTPAITGTAEANSTVTVTLDGVVLGTTTADASGNWTLPVTSPLAVSNHTVSATARDAAGNVSNPSAVNTFAVTAYPPPVINSPVTAGSRRPAGTSTAPSGSTITLYNNGTPVATATVQSNGTWQIPSNITLVNGDALTATVTYNSATSGLSNTVYVSSSTTPKPTVSSPIYSGASSVSGTSSSPAGAIIDVYALPSGSSLPVYLGTTTVQSGGTWTLSGLSSQTLAAGMKVEAKATDVAGGLGTSDFSNQVTVSQAVPPPPTVNAPLYAGATSVSGTSTAPAGSTITVYVNGGNKGTTTVQADGTWTITGLTALTDGQNVKARVTVGGQQSSDSNLVYVSANTGDLTPAPSITAPVVAGATSVSGTSASPSGTRIDVYANGLWIGNTTALSGGAWSLTGLSALAAGTQLTATATDSANNHGTSVSSSPVTVVNVPPAVHSPIVAGASSISGTSASPAGTAITVYRNGAAIGTTTVFSGGTWTLSGVSGLQGGETITAKAGADGAQSAVSNSVVVTPAAPVVNGPLYPGGTSVSGSSTAPVGSTVTISVAGTPYTTTVQSGGAWSITVAALTAGQNVSATVTAGGQTSAVSNTVTVANDPPVVTSPIVAGASSISGTSTAAAGTTITVDKGGISIGTTTVAAGGGWTLSGVSGLIGGESITATAGTGAVQSQVSAAVIVTPAPPVISGPLYASQTTVSGTSTAPAGSTLTLTVGATPYTTTVQSGGTWSVTVAALTAGQTLSATVTANGMTSAPSAALTVQLPNLLRYGGVTSLSPMTPAAATIFVNYPGDPSLDPTRDMEVTAYASGASFSHETTDLSPTTPVLVFYQLEGDTGSTLRVTKSGGKVVITY